MGTSSQDKYRIRFKRSWKIDWEYWLPKILKRRKKRGSLGSDNKKTTGGKKYGLLVKSKTDTE